MRRGAKLVGLHTNRRGIRAGQMRRVGENGDVNGVVGDNSQKSTIGGGNYLPDLRIDRYVQDLVVYHLRSVKRTLKTCHAVESRTL